jgi:hypothetical protein
VRAATGGNAPKGSAPTRFCCGTRGFFRSTWLVYMSNHTPAAQPRATFPGKHRQNMKCETLNGTEVF